MKMHPDNKVSCDVTPCFSEADWRLAAPPASYVFFNLISPLLLKPKLLSILVIAGMNRTRWVSNLWRMPPLIMIKLSEAEVSAVGRKWPRSSGGRCFFLRAVECKRQQQAGDEGILYNICIFRWGIGADFQREFHSRMDSFTEINSNRCSSVSSGAVVRLNNVFLIGFGQQWSSAAQKCGCG